MNLFRGITFGVILALTLFFSACVARIPMEDYQPLAVKPVPKAQKVVICVQPFEDETKNGFANKRWVGSRNTMFGTLDKDYELKESSIAEMVTQAVAIELASQGFQVIQESAPKKFLSWKKDGEEVNEDCHYIVKGRIKKFWCKVFLEVTTDITLEVELVNADTGKTIWLKKELKNSSQDLDEVMLNSQNESQWIAENIRSTRDYVIRKLFRDEKLQVLLTRKVQ